MKGSLLRMRDLLLQPTKSNIQSWHITFFISRKLIDFCLCFQIILKVLASIVSLYWPVEFLVVGLTTTRSHKLIRLNDGSGKWIGLRGSGYLFNKKPPVYFNLNILEQSMDEMQLKVSGAVVV